MKVFVVCCGDYEGSFFDSVWSSEELAQTEVDRLNAMTRREDPYYYEEIEVDKSSADQP